MQAIDEVTGLTLARRPHILANVGLTWTPMTGTAVGASLDYIGARFDNGADSVPLESARTINLFASYALSAQLQVFGRVENLFDNSSEPLFGYGALTRGYFAGLRATL
jgi:vitamin B12 transporter